MAVFRVKKDKENPYVMLNKEFLNDDKLSWKAKGVLAYLLSLPDDWQIYESEVVKHSKDGKDSLKSAIKELMANGYLEREQTRDEKGCFKGYDYVVNESSNRSGFSNNGRSDIGEPATTNNNETNNNKTNIISMVEATKERVDYKAILEKYNSIEGDRVSKCKSITPERKKHLNARIKEYGIEGVYKVIDNINSSNFLKNKFGLNTKDKKKKLSIDWIINPNNFVKILEGSYTDTTSKQPKTSYNTNNMLG